MKSNRRPQVWIAQSNYFRILDRVGYGSFGETNLRRKFQLFQNVLKVFFSYIQDVDFQKLISRFPDSRF